MVLSRAALLVLALALPATVSAQALRSPASSAVDDDHDGIPTSDERPGGRDRDTDRDGLADHLDADDDNDGTPTRDERSDISRDTDADGLADHLDADDDNDGIPSRSERASDTDHDGLPDRLDDDDDGDGTLTFDEVLLGTDPFRRSA